MSVKIHTQDPILDSTLSDYTDEIIRLSLGLFQRKILRIEVFLTVIDVGKLGQQKHCKIIICTNRNTAIVAEEKTSDFYESISLCSGKIKRAVVRHFDGVLQGQTMTMAQPQIPDKGQLPK